MPFPKRLGTLPKNGSKRSFSAACIWDLPPGPVAREIPRPAGKGAGLRDDATVKMKFSGRSAPLKPKDGLNGPPVRPAVFVFPRVGLGSACGAGLGASCDTSAIELPQAKGRSLPAGAEARLVLMGIDGTSETRALPKNGSEPFPKAARSGVFRRPAFGLPPGPVAWEIPRPAGKGAGLRDDATSKDEI